MATSGTISDIFNEYYNTGTHSKDFTIWIDRQVRPTIGADINNKRCTDRKSVGSIFSIMLQTLIDAIHALIPQHLGDVYLTYSTGDWQQSKAFHIKAHLTTKAFLALIDQLCKKYKCPGMSQNYAPVESAKKLKEILESRHNIDHRGSKLRGFAASSFVTLEPWSSEMFRVACVYELDYPLVGLYKQRENESTAAILETELPGALDILENFVSTGWNQKGFAVCMVLAPDSEPTSSPLCYSVYVAAIVKESEFAEQMPLKTKKQVTDSWGWTKPDRGVKPFLVHATKPDSSSIFSYGSYIGKEAVIQPPIRLSRRKN